VELLHTHTANQTTLKKLSCASEEEYKSFLTKESPEGSLVGEKIGRNNNGNAVVATNHKLPFHLLKESCSLYFFKS
jgi:hypothetical protein